MSMASTKHPNPSVGGRTKQAPASETDINLIVKRFLKTGVMPTRPGKPVYADVSDVPERAVMLQHMNAGRALFETLTPGDQAKFRGDVSVFLAWLSQQEKLKAEKTVEPVEKPAPKSGEQLEVPGTTPTEKK